VFAIEKATPAVLDAVARIYAHYVTESVATFEENVPTVADWQVRFDDFAARGLPFLVARVDGEVAGYAYAGPWRPKPAYRHTAEDTIYLDPAYAGRTHQPQHHFAAAGTASDQARAVIVAVDPQFGDRPGQAAGGAAALGRRHVDREQLPQRPGQGTSIGVVKHQYLRSVRS